MRDNRREDALIQAMDRRGEGPRTRIYSLERAARFQAWAWKGEIREKRVEEGRVFHATMRDFLRDAFDKVALRGGGGR